jgi:GH18 family chitinase
VTQGQKFFATFETSQALAAKAVWLRSKGLGGMMLYEIGLDLDATQPFGQRNPLVKAATSAMNP